LLAAVTACAGEQTAKKENEPEQTVFGADPQPQGFIRKPVQVPPAALQVLRDSLGRGAVNCLKHNGITADDVPASWFVASEIHLDGPEEIDLIVQPNLPKIGTDELPHHEAFGLRARSQRRPVLGSQKYEREVWSASRNLCARLRGFGLAKQLLP
jgi:hypothetical protein